jgi:D-amino-acid dehydrogenase
MSASLRSDDALVIGAGVVGVSTAYALARRGLSVAIVDRLEGPAHGTSFANGAQLSYTYTDALASARLLKRLPWLAFGVDPAFRIRKRLDPDFLRWGLAFLRNCTQERFEANTLTGLRLALKSQLALGDLLARHPLEFGHEAPGKLHLYEDAGALAEASQLAVLKAAAGAEQQIVSPSEIVTIEPALASISGRLQGAVWSPREEVGDPYLFSAALLRCLEERYAVRASFGLSVECIVADGEGAAAYLDNGERISARHILVCAGHHAPKLVRSLGMRVPIMPVRGHSFTAPLGPEAPHVSITDTARKLVFCRLSGSLRVAGQADVGFTRTAADGRRIRALFESARASLPQAADYRQPTSVWAGLRPVTPNSLPIIERHGAIILNVGHGALGWTYAMGSAEEAARLVCKERC